MLKKRHQQILGLLSTDEEVRALDLMSRLGVSEATLRRDLTELSADDKIIRTHGGALLRPEAVREASFRDKESAFPERKQAIARTVEKMLPSNCSVFIDSGTTCLEAGRKLLKRGACQIYTNSVPLLVDGCNASAQVTGIGGVLRAVSKAMVGPTSLAWLDHLHFDYALIGASALDAERGAFTTEPYESAVKQQAIAAAATSILLCDSAKLEQSAPVRYARWTDFDHWVSDHSLPDEMRQRLAPLPVSLA